MSAPLPVSSKLLGLFYSSCAPQWRMFHQIPHGNRGKHYQFWCLILGPLTLHGTGSVQDIPRSLPLVLIWVDLPDLTEAGILGRRQGSHRCGSM